MRGIKKKMKSFKEYYHMKKVNADSTDATEEYIIKLNEDGGSAREQVQILLSILRDYGDRLTIPHAVRSRCRQLAMELTRMLRSL